MKIVHNFLKKIGKPIQRKKEDKIRKTKAKNFLFSESEEKKERKNFIFRRK